MKTLAGILAVLGFINLLAAIVILFVYGPPFAVIDALASLVAFKVAKLLL